VVRGLAERFKLQQLFIKNDGASNEVYRSDWIILSHNEELMNELKQAAKKPRKNPPPAILWTDEWNNIFDVLEW
jgi:hypothetical protein